MKYGVLNQKHPCYDADLWCRYEALYAGGTAFRKHVGKFLRTNPMEPPDVYHQRLQEAYYRSYVGPIVDFFAAQLMAAPMTVRATGDDGETAEPDPFYADFKEDVDGDGCDLVDFARDSFRSALIKRSCWWLASLPSDSGIEANSKAEWEDRGLGRVCLHKLEPETVLDWECHADGTLSWAILFEELCPRMTPGSSRSHRIHRFRVVDRWTVETFEIAFDENNQPNGDTNVPSVSKEPHGFSRVPLIHVETPIGLWLMNRVADAQVEHFRLSSGLGWAIRRTCYAMPVFKVGSDTELGTMGTGYALKIGREDEIAWAAPPAQPFEVIATEIRAQKDEIYRVAQQMAHGVDNNAAAVGRSAQSKMADTTATEVCLKAYGAVMREALEAAYDLVVDGRKDSITFSVQGLDRFNLADAAIEVENTTKAKALAIPSATFAKELLVKTAESLLPSLEQDKKDAIREEIESGVDAAAKAAEEAAKRLALQPANDEEPDDESGIEDEADPQKPVPPAAA